MQDAGCRGMGQDMFFPKRGGGQRKAKKVCEACVVRTDCRDYAERTNTHYGIWGGEVLKRWGDNGSASDNQSDGQIDLGLVLENEVVETLADFATSATVTPEIPPDANNSGDHPFDKQAPTVLIIDAPRVSPGRTSLEIQYVSSSSETVSSHEVEVVHVHAIDCDLDEDCSCHVAELAGISSPPSLLPLCPPD